ncbi:hypothetical protein K458DRAFT_489045 [Lentithecium fluviatile CBS 122367]|uniref:RBR-type E3 ubiquitin transferase n=1 Tax=Lentithecium fluviatile CBS 122367 TaxID=1168545 RepID=A0A6G1IVF3_9PLEO|nr:hypothetical protein K458DRAFT_489045 [Lentithecium fluviatile CBS 122367]
MGNSTSKMYKCASCEDVFGKSNVLLDTCGDPGPHAYCRDCVTSFVKFYIAGEAVVPGCYDGPFELESVKPILAPGIVAQFVDKLERDNRQLPESQRHYCSNPRCSAWIKPALVKNGVATCPRQDCNQRACVLCKNEAHDGTCSENEDIQKLKALANKRSWKQCPSCGHMICKDKGCKHMTCRCTYEFCFVCLQQWPCECDQPRGSANAFMPFYVPIPADHYAAMDLGNRDLPQTNPDHFGDEWQGPNEDWSVVYTYTGRA